MSYARERKCMYAWHTTIVTNILHGVSYWKYDAHGSAMDSKFKRPGIELQFYNFFFQKYIPMVNGLLKLYIN